MQSRNLTPRTFDHMQEWNNEKNLLLLLLDGDDTEKRMHHNQKGKFYGSDFINGLLRGNWYCCLMEGGGHMLGRVNFLEVVEENVGGSRIHTVYQTNYLFSLYFFLFVFFWNENYIDEVIEDINNYDNCQ